MVRWWRCRRRKRVQKGGKNGLGQFSWTASCVPAVCQRNAEWRGERPIISHTHTLSLAFHTPETLALRNQADRFC